MKQNVKDYVKITFSTILVTVGVYFFKFPNNFTFGGVTGLSVVLGHILPISASIASLILNGLLLILGLFFWDVASELRPFIPAYSFRWVCL